MDPVDIRKILLDVPIPKKEEEGARTFVIEKIPSIAPMLKDLRGETSEYGSGLATAMAKIIRAIEGASVPNFLRMLQLEDVYSADEQLRSGWNIEAEYPTLGMANILGLGQFGAGVCLAFALTELAMTRAGMAGSSPATVTGIEAAEEPEEEEPEEVLADMGQITAKKPHAGRMQAASRPQATPIQAAPKKQPRPVPSPQPAPLTTSLPEGLPLVALNIYGTPNGFRIVGDVAPTLQALAQAYAVVRECFGIDANVVADRRGNLSFTFSVISEGEEV